MTGTRGFTGTHLFVALVTGAAAGAAVALLTAQRTGKETRAALQSWAQDTRSRAGRLPNAVGKAVERAAQAGKEAFTESYDGDADRKRV